MTDLFQTSGTSPTTDFICENRVSLFLIIPLSASAKMWIQENLPTDRMTFADAVLSDPRFAWAILTLLQDDGLVVARG